jgi:peptidyl-prolyl cis-trans isomerase C
MKKIIHSICLVNYVVFACAATHADGVVISNQDINITSEKIKKEYLAQPLAIKDKLRNDEVAIAKFVDAIRNELLFEKEAEKSKLRDDPLVVSKIDIAVRKILIEQLIQNKKKSIKIPDMTSLVKAEYDAHPESYLTNESIHARHILVKFDDKNKAEKLTFIESLKKRIEKGEDFVGLAKQFSEDKGSADKGGDLGVFGRGQMVKPFEEAVFALKQPKQLSSVVETQFGLHLIQLVERQSAKRKSFKEIKAELIAAKEQEYMNNELKTWRDSILDPSKAKLNEAELEKVIDEIKKSP